MIEPVEDFTVQELFPENSENDEAVAEVKKAFSAKGLARFAVGSSVKFVVTTTLVSLVPTETRLQKGKLMLGSYVISGVIAEKAKDFISEDLDDKFEFCRDVFAYAKKLKQDETTPNEQE